MDIVFDDTRTTSKKRPGINSKQFIILHHTGGTGLWASLTNYLSGSNRYVSTHYTVGKNGEIGKIGEDNDILWHVGLGSHPQINNGQESNLNPYSIGIEIVSNGVEYTDTQRDAVEKLCVYLCLQHKIPTHNILRHLDVSGYRGKWDVGINFFKNQLTPMGTFRETIESKLETEQSLENVSIWAKVAAEKAMNKGVIKNWSAPQEIVASQKMGWIWYNLGLLDRHPAPEGITLEQVAVVLDREKKLD